MWRTKRVSKARGGRLRGGCGGGKAEGELGGGLSQRGMRIRGETGKGAVHGGGQGVFRDKRGGGSCGGALSPFSERDEERKQVSGEGDRIDRFLEVLRGGGEEGTGIPDVLCTCY